MGAFSRQILPASLALALLAAGCGDMQLGVWTAEDGVTGSETYSYGQDFLDDVYSAFPYGDFVYATDPATDLVIKLDTTKQGTSEEFVWEAGGSGSGDLEFSSPAGIAVNSGGAVFVADSGNGRVQKISSSGDFLLAFGESDLSKPAGMAIDSQGYLYVADETLDTVVKFNGSGSKITQFGSGSGSADGELDTPMAVAVDYDQNVYVLSKGNYRVDVFSSAGVYKSSFGENGSGNGQFSDPRGLAVDSQKRVYVSDYSQGRVQRFDSSGQYIDEFSTDDNDGALSSPQGVAVKGSYLYIAETGANRVRKVPLSLFSTN